MIFFFLANMILKNIFGLFSTLGNQTPHNKNTE